LIPGGAANTLQAIREVADRLDGKPAPAIECTDVAVHMMGDAEPLIIAAGGVQNHLDV
jgi:hypothetical protein